MRALAKASKALDTVPEAIDAAPPSELAGDGEDLAFTAAEWGFGTLWRDLSKHRGLVWLAVGLLVTTVVAVFALTRGPRFVEALFPAEPLGALRPLVIEPNTPIQLVFSALGVRPPKPHPESPLLARYDYGSDLIVDALNDVVHAITLAVPGRTWRGLRVGLPERNAEGLLALLGPLREGEPATTMVSAVTRGYETYPSVEQRPRREHKVEVRPPNGCFDVLVEIRPRVIGLLLSGNTRMAVVARGRQQPEWVITQIRVVSRSLPDVRTGEIVC